MYMMSFILVELAMEHTDALKHFTQHFTTAS